MSEQIHNNPNQETRRSVIDKVGKYLSKAAATVGLVAASRPRIGHADEGPEPWRHSNETFVETHTINPRWIGAKIETEFDLNDALLLIKASQSQEVKSAEAAREAIIKNTVQIFGARNFTIGEEGSSFIPTQQGGSGTIIGSGKDCLFVLTTAHIALKHDPSTGTFELYPEISLMFNPWDGTLGAITEFFVDPKSGLAIGRIPTGNRGGIQPIPNIRLSGVPEINGDLPVSQCGFALGQPLQAKQLMITDGVMQSGSSDTGTINGLEGQRRVLYSNIRPAMSGGSVIDKIKGWLIGVTATSILEEKAGSSGISLGSWINPFSNGSLAGKLIHVSYHDKLGNITAPRIL